MRAAIVEAARRQVRGRGHGRRRRARRRSAARPGRGRTPWRRPRASTSPARRRRRAGRSTARSRRPSPPSTTPSPRSSIPGIAPNHGSYLPIEVDRALRAACSTPAPRRPSSGATCSRTASRPSSWPRSARRSPSGRSPPTTATRTCTSSPPPTRTGRANVQFEIEVGRLGRAAGSRRAGLSVRRRPQPRQQPDRARRERVPAAGSSATRLRQDSGGAGRFRGGLGAERTFELLADCELSSPVRPGQVPPPGLHGGSAGAAAQDPRRARRRDRRAPRQVERSPPVARRSRHGSDPGRRRARAMRPNATLPRSRATWRAARSRRKRLAPRTRPR